MRPTATLGYQGQTILIVDDTPANVGVLVDYLEDNAFRVIVAQDGLEGIKRAEFAQPDLILLDVMMPGMDGFETCKRLKANPQIKDIPVIFMTALTDSNEKVTGFEAGAVDYVTKPFQIEEVLARVNTHLSLRAMQRQLEQQNVQLQQEIAVRLQAEAELRLTQFSVDHAADAVLWLTVEGKCSYVNDAACRMLKYARAALLELSIHDLNAEPDFKDWPTRLAQVRNGPLENLETRLRQKGGLLVPVELSLSYFEYRDQQLVCIFARDISERKQAERSLNESYSKLKESNQRLEELHHQLLQAEKMASIGQLAAGVAHEINNPIAFVNSNLATLNTYVGGLLELLALYEQAQASISDTSALAQVQSLRARLDIDYMRADLKNLMAESQEGVQRVRRIVQDLKDFSHVGEVERQHVDLHPGLDSTLNIVMSELRQHADIVKEYGDIPPIDGVPAQLNQVFMNLLVNAAQSMQKRGVITIRTGSDGAWVWVDIEDTGSGIAPENLSRIFEPFFTTKPVGKGTGLGLSLSYGIIAQHGGRIEVESTVGTGTRFRVWLPIKAPSALKS